MTDKGFAQRINIACDQNPHIPAYGMGRQTWVKEKMGVSHEAVRKWFLGEARPRPDKLTQLANVLECDEAWLALGKKGDLDPREKRARSLNIEGAVNAVTGLLQLNGANCAFPGDKDPLGSYVDIYAITRGVQLAIHVSLGKQGPPNQFRFAIPKEYENCKVIGVVHARANRLHLLNMDYDMVTKYAERKGGFFEVCINWHDNAYWSGSDKWTRIESFTKDL
ncbi:helix-turn-helix domain-containing protein [Sinorhizobium medicae]|nr:helix-turn-helix domain-containing protein [Sinorhizobium medicae]